MHTNFPLIRARLHMLFGDEFPINLPTYVILDRIILFYTSNMLEYSSTIPVTVGVHFFGASKNHSMNLFCKSCSLYMISSVTPIHKALLFKIDVTICDS